ncbi:Vmc-like lipoprotein signal peptide domain-containing protein [Mycoplasma todarodis]|uniref:Vmc-like lipoprotein signal peptide domain-containing protein n=1 Tax=Mycoplasma todarodis TaxID=1937191 RepID=UPI003B389B4F
MKKLLSTLGVVATVATPLATVVACGTEETEKKVTTNEVLKNINTELNELAHVSGDSNGELAYDDFYDLIISPFENGNAASNNVISALISETDDRIEQIIDNIKNQSVPAGQAATNTFIGNQIQAYFDELETLSTQISSGYVGHHDINYYKTLIDERVEKVVFDSNTDAMNTKIADAKTQIDEVTNFLTNDLNGLKTDVETHIASIHASIIEHKADNQKDLEDLNTKLVSQLNDIASLTQSERDAIKEQLGSQLALITTLQNMADQTYQDLIISNANTNASIDAIMEKANSMELELSHLNNYLIDYDTYITSVIDGLSSEVAQGNLAAWEGIQSNYSDIFMNQLHIHDNKTEIENINTNLTNLESRIQENKQNIEDLDDKLLNAEADLKLSADQLDQKIDTNMRLTEDNIKIILDRMTDHENAINTIENAIADNHSLATENQNLLSTVQDSIANIFHYIEQLTELANDNQAKTWNIESEVQALRNDVEDLSSDIIFSTNFHNDANHDLFTQRWYIDDIKSYSSIRFIYELENDSFSTSAFDVALIPGDSGVRVYNHDGTIFQAHEYSMKAIVDLDNNFVQLTSPRTSTLGIRGYQPEPLGARILSVIANKLS